MVQFFAAQYTTTHYNGQTLTPYRSDEFHHGRYVGELISITTVIPNGL